MNTSTLRVAQDAAYPSDATPPMTDQILVKIADIRAALAEADDFNTSLRQRLFAEANKRPERLNTTSDSVADQISSRLADLEDLAHAVRGDARYINSRI